ncbi:DUF554 domain-containing protein [Brassicibacter mesophilus]|uniref:DUF554 domain-containing protein n=1 Tax=Brassicibacter mesophilus TaxID=745119 RepID=UPI003D24DC7E
MVLGTVVNVITIITGSLVGVFLKNRFKENYRNTIMNGLGMIVIIIGLMSALKTEDILLVIMSVVIGSIIGEWIRIEDRLENLGNMLERKAGQGSSNFSKGFVTASLIYCVGAMAIVGSLESGLTGNHQTLFAKSIIDGVSSIIFSSTLGIGVAFSAVSVFVYQGIITLSASFAKEFLIESVIREMAAVGGILIIGIGINILEIKRIKIGNMLPAIFIPLLYFIISSVVYKLI